MRYIELNDGQRAAARKALDIITCDPLLSLAKLPRIFGGALDLGIENDLELQAFDAALASIGAVGSDEFTWDDTNGLRDSIFSQTKIAGAVSL